MAKYIKNVYLSGVLLVMASVVMVWSAMVKVWNVGGAIAKLVWQRPHQPYGMVGREMTNRSERPKPQIINRTALTCRDSIVTLVGIQMKQPPNGNGSPCTYTHWRRKRGGGGPLGEKFRRGRPPDSRMKWPESEAFPVFGVGSPLANCRRFVPPLKNPWRRPSYTRFIDVLYLLKRHF